MWGLVSMDVASVRKGLNLHDNHHEWVARPPAWFPRFGLRAFAAPVVFVFTVVMTLAATAGAQTPDNAMAKRWWNVLTPEEMVAALHGDDATPAEAAAAKKMYAGLDGETKRLVNAAAAAIYGEGGFASVGAWWESLDCRLMRVAAGDGDTADASSAYCTHYPGSGAAKILGAAEKAQVDEVGQALLGRSDPGVYPADNAMAKRWWNVLTPEEMVAALHGDDATPAEAAAAKKMYAGLDGETKRLVNAAAAAIYGEGGFASVGAWWESLDCRLMRVAAGDGDTADASSAYCTHYPGSGAAKILGAAEKAQVDEVGQALLGRSDPGVYPADNAMAKRWWNVLTPEEMVAALHGDDATPAEAAAAKKMYAGLDAETKRLVNAAAAAIYGEGGFASVGAWWESLDCRLMRVAAGDGDTADASSAYCTHYPGSGAAKILGAAEKAQVDEVGQALLGRSDPGVYPADNAMAKRWWNVLTPEEMVAALHGDDATPAEAAAAKKMYAGLDAETKRLVNAAAAAIYGEGGFASVGAWWESLDCRLMRVAAGDGDTADASSAYCAHYPGSGAAKILGAAEKAQVDEVGQALLGRSDPGVYPPFSVDKIVKVLLPETTRARLASTVDAVRARVGTGLDGSPETKALNIGGAGGWLQAFETHGPQLEEDGFEAARLLAGSSFVLPLNAADGGSSTVPGGAVFWGSGDWRDLSGADSGVSWDGRMTSGHLGADMRLSRNLLAGLSMSLSRGRFDYKEGKGSANTGTYETTLTSVHPYAGLILSPGVELWALAGYGRGDVDIKDDQKGLQTGDLTQTSGAAGVEGEVFSSDDVVEGGRTTVHIRADGSFARAKMDGSDTLASISVDVRRLRASLEARHAHAMAESAILTPSVEVGLRSDGGDGATGTGVEIGSALSYRDTALGLTLEVRGRALTGHGGDTKEWGIGGLIRKDSGGDGLGLSLSIAPGLGAVHGGAGSSLRKGSLAVADGGQDEVGGHLVTEAGYGLSALSGRGLVTPYAAVTLSEDGGRSYRAGSRLQLLGSSAALSLEGAHRQVYDDDNAEYELMLRASMSW